MFLFQQKRLEKQNSTLFRKRGERDCRRRYRSAFTRNKPRCHQYRQKHYVLCFFHIVTLTCSLKRKYIRKNTTDCNFSDLVSLFAIFSNIKHENVYRKYKKISLQFKTRLKNGSLSLLSERKTKQNQTPTPAKTTISMPTRTGIHHGKTSFSVLKSILVSISSPWLFLWSYWALTKVQRMFLAPLWRHWMDVA